MKRTAILLRAKSYDIATATLYHDLSSLPMEVFFIADETSGPFDNPARSVKIPVSPGVYSGMGLLTTSDIMWRCGDYGYYVAAQSLPDFDEFWMIEPDVRINFSDIADFFLKFATVESDFVCSRFKSAYEHWQWRATMASQYQQVFECFFPLTRLSRRAINHLYGQRVAATQRWDGPPHLWPNDEVFVATCAATAGFDIKSLGDVIPGVDPIGTFGINIFPKTKLDNEPPDQQLYHRVLAGMEFLRHLILALNQAVTDDWPAQHIRERFERAVVALEIECGGSVVDDFRRRIDASIVEVELRRRL